MLNRIRFRDLTLITRPSTSPVEWAMVETAAIWDLRYMQTPPCGSVSLSDLYIVNPGIGTSGSRISGWSQVSINFMAQELLLLAISAIC